jgi:hypothetical protein
MSKSKTKQIGLNKLTKNLFIKSFVFLLNWKKATNEAEGGAVIVKGSNSILSKTKMSNYVASASLSSKNIEKIESHNYPTGKLEFSIVVFY